METANLGNKETRQISNLNNVEETLAYHVKINELITSISNRFIDVDLEDMNHEIFQALERVGQFAKVDCSYAIFCTKDGRHLENMVAWCDEGVVSPELQLRKENGKLLKWFMGELKESAALLYPTVTDNMKQQSGLTEQLKSLIVVPMVYDHHIIGVVGLETYRAQKSWEKEKKIMTLLKIMGEIFVQVTARQHAEEELKKKEQLMLQQARHAQMGEMLSMIAHQWRQPLATISVIASNLNIQLELGQFKEEKLPEQLQKIINNTQFLSNTVDEFRNFFKPKKNKERVSLSELLDKSLMMMGKSEINKRIQLERHTELTKPIDTYANEIMQVFLNILKNAEDVINERKISTPVISIRMFEKEKYQVVEIEDNAGGIPEKIKDRLFLPYFTTKDDLNGTGLGLYMSKTIIEDHLNGQLKAENGEDGAIFTIKLPVIDETLNASTNPE